MEEKQKFFTSKNITFLGVLTALIIVLQVLGSNIVVFGTVRLSFVLVPIVLGAIMLGVRGGVFLGFVFGLITIIMGAVGADPFTYVLLNESPFLCVATCLVKAVCAGLISALTYKSVSVRNKTIALFVSAIVAPVVNTGLFILGALAMGDVLNDNFVANGESLIHFLIIGCAGINFLVELSINVVLAPALRVVLKAFKF
ncbi:MAG: ECF transporter S component [Acutalibacteraceae bacterium]